MAIMLQMTFLIVFFKENVWIVIQIWSTNFSKSFLLMVKLSKS